MVEPAGIEPASEANSDRPNYDHVPDIAAPPRFRQRREPERLAIRCSVMRQASTTLSVRTTHQGLIEITDRVMRWLDGEAFDEGLLTIFCRHTSASLLIQENAAPAARRDLEAYFARIAPEDPRAYAHDDEGPDDMPAHLRAALTQTSLSVPIFGGVPVLGTWQGIYLFEHRRRPHVREIALHVIGT